jgi:hypothetical protein
VFEVDIEHALEQARIPRSIALESFAGDRRARDVAAQPFEFLALMRAAAHPGMQAETVLLGAQARGGFLLPASHGGSKCLTNATPFRSQELLLRRIVAQFLCADA